MLAVLAKPADTLFPAEGVLTCVRHLLATWIIPSRLVLGALLSFVGAIFDGRPLGLRFFRRDIDKKGLSGPQLLANEDRRERAKMRATAVTNGRIFDADALKFNQVP